ncbi:hypothetical protein BT93_L4108 [Corymbia citriodora subsp. variegata]|uniref:Uncharacterized protein n=1 Tax=Corymbia citriodora subsp. variegata TaxID=360336 RepID=A0A8T0CYN9_CORYI|nr:hypothetical protein BT93_L4108 [Corymbia citriodora subsp. variegata]
MSLLSRYGRSACSRSRKLRGPSTLLRLAFLSTASPDPLGAPSPARLGGPPPIRVGLTESAGRGVFATRRIGSGELIHTAEPVVSHPSLRSLHAVCYSCLRKLNSAGSPAHAVSFCSDDCRARSQAFYEVETRVDWSSHDAYCRYEVPLVLLLLFASRSRFHRQPVVVNHSLDYMWLRLGNG